MQSSKSGSRRLFLSLCGGVIGIQEKKMNIIHPIGGEQNSLAEME
jgi:hypothetical protein